MTELVNRLKYEATVVELCVWVGHLDWICVVFCFIGTEVKIKAQIGD